jgi:hypothetical protein
MTDDKGEIQDSRKRAQRTQRRALLAPSSSQLLITDLLITNALHFSP